MSIDGCRAEVTATTEGKPHTHQNKLRGKRNSSLCTSLNTTTLSQQIKKTALTHGAGSYLASTSVLGDPITAGQIQGKRYRVGRRTETRRGSAQNGSGH
ncbi:unnamed protein product [Pleuronectes platessa]|uniref:Uncharacterized protein n=1 Tax=Pleuronectes platessa TaxID=8262 RepID=A0A9N7VP57_PLEPL|nr:unnamed protein product [Pleuronectes platessa]